MDGISQVGQSIEAVSRILEFATEKSTELAKKMVNVSVEMAVGRESGKGASFDAVA